MAAVSVGARHVTPVTRNDFLTAINKIADACSAGAGISDAPLGELHRGEIPARYALRCGLAERRKRSTSEPFDEKAVTESAVADY